jgi:hypothetical protein
MKLAIRGLAVKLANASPPPRGGLSDEFPKFGKCHRHGLNPGVGEPRPRLRISEAGTLLSFQPFRWVGHIGPPRAMYASETTPKVLYI